MALLVTLAWGGHPGSRPVFLITGPPDDPKCGRGVGKSFLAFTLSSLVGGHMDFSQNDDVNNIKKRLLSKEAVNYRVGVIDNIKAHRFSFAEFESLITTPLSVVTECTSANGSAQSFDLDTDH